MPSDVWMVLVGRVSLFQDDCFCTNPYKLYISNFHEWQTVIMSLHRQPGDRCKIIAFASMFSINERGT